jgi:heavy metal translocating P-type ATPase
MREHSVPTDDHDHRDLDRWDLTRIGLLALVAALTWFHVWQPVARLDVLAMAGLLVGGWPIWREALEALLERRMTMELSMTIAIGAAAVIGEFFTALVIVLFVLVAEVLEGLTVGRGRKAIKQLVDLLPRVVLVRRGGREHEVSADELQLGEIILVKPGARIPIDGIVAGGHSFVDQATITGESMPVEKLPGEQVFAGTINQSGALEIRTTGIGRDTAFGRIIEAVERAEQSRAPIEKTADRLAGYLVYFALACAGFTFLVTGDARATISVIIVAGACGVAAGTPLAVLGGIGRAARLGSIIKGGAYLEALGRVQTVVLDKTGTLTLGMPEVAQVLPVPGVTAVEVLETAAIAEKRSEHPLAMAILRRAATEMRAAEEPETFQYQPGHGIVASRGGAQILVGNRAFLAQHGVDATSLAPPTEGQTEVLVARSGQAIGAIRLCDVLRPEAREAIRELRDLGLRTVLLTGDSVLVARAVGNQLQIDEVCAELMPQQKQQYVEALQRDGQTVAMIGDGVNDAPALAQASVGVAMGSGTAVAMESADVVLIGSDLGKFVETVRIARRCKRIIWQNFAGTLVVDGLGVSLAALGLLNPLLAAFIHVASELTFILNSTRLLPRTQDVLVGPAIAPQGSASIGLRRGAGHVRAPRLPVGAAALRRK